MGLWVRPATPTGRAGAYFVAPFADGLALLGLFGGIRATHHECLLDASGLRGGAAALRPIPGGGHGRPYQHIISRCGHADIISKFIAAAAVNGQELSTLNIRVKWRLSI